MSNKGFISDILPGYKTGQQIYCENKHITNALQNKYNIMVMHVTISSEKGSYEYKVNKMIRYNKKTNIYIEKKQAKWIWPKDKIKIILDIVNEDPIQNIVIEEYFEAYWQMTYIFIFIFKLKTEGIPTGGTGPRLEGADNPCRRSPPPSFDSGARSTQMNINIMHRRKIFLKYVHIIQCQTLKNG